MVLNITLGIFGLFVGFVLGFCTGAKKMSDFVKDKLTDKEIKDLLNEM